MVNIEQKNQVKLVHRRGHEIIFLSFLYSQRKNDDKVLRNLGHFVLGWRQIIILNKEHENLK